MPLDGIDPLLLEAAKRVRARLGKNDEPDPENVLEWATRYRRIDNQRFSFENFEPVRALYEDEHPRLVVIKPAQRGVSEWAVSYVLFAIELGGRKWTTGKKSGLNVGYIFPTAEALRDFSKERISGLKEESSHLSYLLAGEATEFDSLGFKKIGQSYLYLRGGHTTHVISFPADVLILDEFDQMNAASISLVRRRLNASIVKREVMISTPTFPGIGIHAEYLRSDQRQYESQCAVCDAWVRFNFFRDVYINDAPYEDWRHRTAEWIETANVELRCPKCGVNVPDDVRCATGRWTIDRPDITRTHGYWIPWWPWSFIELKGLCLSAVSDRSEEVTELYRSDLGMPYGAGGGAITADMLSQCAAMASEGVPRTWRNTTMGADIGSRINYRISSEDEHGRVWVRAMGTVPNWSGVDSLDSLMRQYSVRMAIVDYEPELRNALDFAKRWRGRAWAAFYLTNLGALQGSLYNIPEESKKKKGKTDDKRLVQVNRTMAMDDLHLAVMNAREIWLPSIALDPDIVAQMVSPTRVKIDDENGQPKPSWVHSTPDHYFHASVYDLLARRLLPKGADFAVAVGGERPMLKAMAQQYLVSRRAGVGAVMGGRSARVKRDI